MAEGGLPGRTTKITPENLRPPVPPDNAGQGRPAFDLLLQIEAEARRAATIDELAFLAANETLKLTRARQIFVLVGRPAPRVRAVSSTAQVEKNAPRIRWIEGIVKALADDVGLAVPREFALPAYCPRGDDEHRTFPFRYLAWLPFTLRDGHVFGGMLLARELPWNEPDLRVATRLAETYAHAWSALTGQRRLRRRPRTRPILLALAIAVVAAGFYPVPMAVLAPAEVVSAERRVVAAPMDGVIAEVEVEPNAAVAPGDVLLEMSDTVLRNELEVAERDVSVAAARLQQVSQAAIRDAEMRGELAVARTELDLAVAKRDYARELFERSTVTAPAEGVAIFTSRRDLIGRPVSTGERLMEVADPDVLELQIDVPVADAVVVESGAAVRAFLDSDPLDPVDAVVRSASFEARMTDDGSLAYRILAAVEEPSPALRLGIRGTAQVLGEDVPLAYYVFRRPIAAIRQWIGL